jgi:hypothetical protein
MDILDLTRSLGVEINELLSSWRTSGLFVVGSQSREKRVGLLGDAIGLIDGASFVGGVVFIIQTLDS